MNSMSGGVLAVDQEREREYFLCTLYIFDQIEDFYRKFIQKTEHRVGYRIWS